MCERTGKWSVPEGVGDSQDAGYPWREKAGSPPVGGQAGSALEAAKARLSALRLPHLKAEQLRARVALIRVLLEMQESGRGVAQAAPLA